jgi:hypothetical protein
MAVKMNPTQRQNYQLGQLTLWTRLWPWNPWDRELWQDWYELQPFFQHYECSYVQETGPLILIPFLIPPTVLLLVAS